MNNTINFNNNTMQAAVAVMNDMVSSKVEVNSMDDAYKAVCKYADATREKFDELYKQANEKFNAWKNSELCEDDLDMVVGGTSAGDVFGAIWGAMKTAGNGVGSFFKEHGVTVAIIAGCMLAGTGIGALAGFGLAHAGIAALVGTTVKSCVVAGAVAGHIAGVTGGALAAL